MFKGKSECAPERGECPERTPHTSIKPGSSTDTAHSPEQPWGAWPLCFLGIPGVGREFSKCNVVLTIPSGAVLAGQTAGRSLSFQGASLLPWRLWAVTIVLFLWNDHQKLRGLDYSLLTRPIPRAIPGARASFSARNVRTNWRIPHARQRTGYQRHSGLTQSEILKVARRAFVELQCEKVTESGAMVKLYVRTGLSKRRPGRVRTGAIYGLSTTRPPSGCLMSSWPLRARGSISTHVETAYNRKQSILIARQGRNGDGLGQVQGTGFATRHVFWVSKRIILGAFISGDERCAGQSTEERHSLCCWDTELWCLPEDMEL